MPHAVAMPDPGLQALILCGPGSSFTTFMAKPEENPKALLPIANRPMVWYPIDFCHRMGITDITLVCPASSAKAISSALSINPHLTALATPKPVLLAPDSLDENAGTAEILRLPEIREIVKGNFIVLPCDLVCELGGEKLIQAWMVSAASLGDVLEDQSFSGGAARNKHSGGIGVWYNTKIATPIKGEETDFIMTAALRPVTATLPKDSILPHVSSLVYSLPTDSLKDLTEEKKGLPIRLGLLRKHPRIRMLTTHRDAHIYIFPKWVLDFVKENEKLDSIGEDVIGWWAKATWQTGLPEKLSMAEALEPEAAKKEEDDSSQEDSTPPQDEDSAELLLRPPGASHAAGHAQGTDAAAKPGAERVVEMPPFLAYVHPSQAQGVVRRVDTAQLLLSVSLQLAKLPSLEDSGADHQEPSSSPFAHARKVAYPEGVKARTTITRADSLVAENVTVEEKAAVKESVVGANCQLREGARLTQCLLMEGVVVGRNCKLTRCILGRRCEIGEGSVLTDCEVQENLLVEPRTEDKENKLMSSEGLEADDDFGDDDVDGDMLESSDA